jgi:hypothetical protein
LIIKFSTVTLPIDKSSIKHEVMLAREHLSDFESPLTRSMVDISPYLESPLLLGPGLLGLLLPYHMRTSSFHLIILGLSLIGPSPSQEEAGGFSEITGQGGDDFGLGLNLCRL